MKLLSTLILLLTSATTHAGIVSAGLQQDARTFLKSWNLKNATEATHTALADMHALAEVQGAKLEIVGNSIRLFLPQGPRDPAKVVLGTLEKDGTLKLESFTATHFNLKDKQEAFRRNDMYTVVRGESTYGEVELVYSFEEIGNVKYRIKNTESLRGRYGTINCDVVTSEKDKSVILFMGDLRGGEKFKHRIEESGKVLDIKTDIKGEYLTVRILKDGKVIEKKYANESMDLVGEPPHKLILKEEAPLTTQQIKELGLIAQEEIIPGLRAAQSTDLPKRRKSR